MPPRGSGHCCAKLGTWARTCTSTWNRSTRVRPCWTSCSRSSPNRSSEPDPRPASSSRPICATRATSSRQILAWARASTRRPPLTVRLVKGAYWDHELVAATQHGWEAPVFRSKSECDRNFEALTQRLVAARPLVRVAIASHNLRSVAHAIAASRAAGGEDRDLEFQVLRGLGDELQAALAAGGQRVRTYCPVGDLVSPGWPTSSAACSRTPPTTRSSPRRRGAPRSSVCSPRRSASHAPGVQGWPPAADKTVWRLRIGL